MNGVGEVIAIGAKVLLQDVSALSHTIGHSTTDVTTFQQEKHTMKKHSQFTNRVKKISALLIGAAICFAPMAHAQQGAPIQKKFIENGFDEPDTARLRANLKQMEQTPFDGVILRAIGKSDDGRSIQLTNTHSADPWKKEWFQNCVDDLKAVHSTKLTDNFLHVGSNPGNVDWFDDAGWNTIVDHWRIAAWIAKEGNLKGLLFDPEPYKKPYKQFQYILQADSGKHTLEQYQAKARQRGREIISAVAEVDPNLVIFTFFMNSVQWKPLSKSNPALAARTFSYNLYPAFIDGWLDATPPTMIFVDGCESSYRYNSNEQYLQAANFMRNDALNLVAPENRQKYATQVQTSFGMYMNVNVNPSTDRYYVDPKGETRMKHLQTNATYAANAATEYVWFYGEQYRWWPTPSKSVKPESWEDKLPGITQALLDVKHPQLATERAVAAAEKDSSSENLLLNANFANGPTKASETTKLKDWESAGLPAKWNSYQDAFSNGVFSFDPKMTHSNDKSGSVRIAGAANGMAIQTVAVKPGESYLVQAWTRHVGQSDSTVVVRWTAPDGKWINEPDIDVSMYNAEKLAQDQWQKIQGIVTVPEGAGNLVVLLIQANQSTKQDVAWYDDVSVSKIK